MHNVVNGKSNVGILHKINTTPIDWYSRMTSTVETLMYGTEFCAARIAVDQIIDIRYSLRMLGVPIIKLPRISLKAERLKSTGLLLILGLSCDAALSPKLDNGPPSTQLACSGWASSLKSGVTRLIPIVLFAEHMGTISMSLCRCPDSLQGGKALGSLHPSLILCLAEHPTNSTGDQASYPRDFLGGPPASTC